MDDVVRRDADESCVKSAVVDLAQGEPIRDTRRSATRVGLDVGRVEQLSKRQPAHRAPTLVRMQHRRPEERLMVTCEHQSLVVAPRDLDDLRFRPDRQHLLAFVDLDDELVLLWFFRHQPYGELRSEDLRARSGDEPDPDEPHERQVPLHRCT